MLCPTHQLRKEKHRAGTPTYFLNMPMFNSWVITEPSTAPRNFPVCKHKKRKRKKKQQANKKAVRCKISKSRVKFLSCSSWSSLSRGLIHTPNSTYMPGLKVESVALWTHLSFESITSNTVPTLDPGTTALETSSNKWEFWLSWLLNYDKSITEFLRIC